MNGLDPRHLICILFQSFSKWSGQYNLPVADVLIGGSQIRGLSTLLFLLEEEQDLRDTFIL